MASYSINPPPPVPSRLRDRKERKVFTKSSSQKSDDKNGMYITNESKAIPAKKHHDNWDLFTDSPLIYLGESNSVNTEYSSDLEGLDWTFQNPTHAGLKKGLSNSMEDLTATSKIYPDISEAFRELQSETAPSSLNFSSQSGSVTNLYSPQDLPNFSSPSYFSQSSCLPLNHYTVHSETMQPITPFQYPSPATLTMKSMQFKSMYSLKQQSALKANKIPSLSMLTRPASLNDLDELSAHTPTTVSSQMTAPIIATTTQAKSEKHIQPSTQDNIDTDISVNLIDFSHDKEYLTLDDFDPYRMDKKKKKIGLPLASTEKTNKDKLTKTKSEDNMLNDYARLEEWLEVSGTNTASLEELVAWANSASVPNQSSICQTSEPYNLVVKLPDSSPKEEPQSLDIVVPIQNCPMRQSKKDVTKQDVDVPARPSSWTFLRKEATYERLKNKTYVDEESEALCKTVTELKHKYKSVDNGTNLGYIVSPICNFSHGPMSIKLIIHTKNQTEALKFTCDINAIVEHVICQGLYFHERSQNEAIPSDYVLKVFDRSEYLLNHLPLSYYEYVHICLKMNNDIHFQIIRQQDIPRKLLRTVDDDRQILYYPRDCIHTRTKGELTRDNLDILMDTFYKEIEKLSDHALQGDLIQPKSLKQSVKAICSVLEQLETMELVSAVERIENIVKDLSNNNKFNCKDSDELSLAVKCNLIENLQDALEVLIIAVKNLVNLYCRTFQTDFLLSSSEPEIRDIQEVSTIRDNFIVHISTAHRIHVKWTNVYHEYTVECGLCYGGIQLSRYLITAPKALTNSGLNDRVLWNEWLHFDSVTLYTLPRETRLSFTLRGIPITSGTSDNTVSTTPVVLAGATIQLFNYKGELVQGSQLVPMRMGTAADPLGPTSSTILSDTVFLQINLPDFGKIIMFPEPPVAFPSIKKSFESLKPEDQEIFNGILEKDSATCCTEAELQLLWEKKYHLMDSPTFLPRVLQAVPKWESFCLPEIYCFLGQWQPLQPTQAFELLLPYYPDIRVRATAVKCLRALPTDELIDYLPQLIQALKFDCYHNSPLAKLLLEKSFISIQFAHKFFWLLKGAAQDDSCQHWYKLMFVALANVAGEALYEEFRKQEDLVKTLSSMAEKLKTAKDKDFCLQYQLEVLYEWFQKKKEIHLPFNPSWEVCGIDLKSCSYYTSHAFPLKLVFKNCYPEAEPVYTMFKVGDDLRQDMLTLQMIRIMDKLWQQENLDLKIITFACLSTGPKKGIVEIVTESETLRKIQVSYGLTGSFKERPLQEWLQKNNPTQMEYEKAVENFMCSCAGYCVATYVLGICDRHNDNIMLKQSGHLFHIDFGKFLGDAQMFGSFKRDRVPFVLTSDMMYVINGGDKNSSRFQQFTDLCCTAFNILRKNRNLFLNFFSLMSRSGIPGVSENAVTYIQQALLPGKSDAEAAAIFTRMIEDSSRSVFTQFNFFLHNLAQLKFSSHNEGALLSFVPKTYSIHTDGRITKLDVIDFEKRYTPEKHYTYVIRIMRQNQKVPSYVFRHFSEFLEFREKLVQRFPLVYWPPLSGKVVFGRSHVRAVALNRKAEISNFLKEMLSKAPEISECDLVYTFFHPLLRDEQRADMDMEIERHSTPDRFCRRGSGIKGDIKLSIQYQKEHLQVMIMHARDLRSSGTETPSTYVKLYMLPDPEKLTKQKTKVVKHSTHPTFNEVMQYKMSLEEVKNRTLQVTVWNHDVLKENQFMGALYIPLHNLDLSRENCEWHCLGNLQMSSRHNLS